MNLPVLNRGNPWFPLIAFASLSVTPSTKVSSTYVNQRLKSTIFLTIVDSEKVFGGFDRPNFTDAKSGYRGLENSLSPFSGYHWPKK